MGPVLGFPSCLRRCRLTLQRKFGLELSPGSHCRSVTDLMILDDFRRLSEDSQGTLTP